MFIVVMEDEGRYDGAALGEAKDCIVGFLLLVYV